MKISNGVNKKISAKKILALTMLAGVFLILFDLAIYPAQIFSIRTYPVQASAEDDLRQQIDDKQKLIQQLEKQIQDYETNIKFTSGQKKTLKNQMASLDTKIKSLLLKINLTRAEIDKAKLEINRLGFQINQKSADLSRNKEYLSGIILAISQSDQESSILKFFKYPQMTTAIKDLFLVQKLQGAALNKLKEIESIKKSLENNQDELSQKKDALDKYKSTLEYQNQNLNDTKQSKKQLLAQTQNQEKKYQSLLQETKKQQEQIQQDIYNLEDKLRQLISADSVPGARSGILAWPLSGYRISQKYGPTSITGFINNAYKFHNGIDIAAPEGTPVKVADDGVVVGIGNSNYAYGKWITIKHSNGLTTLYGHFSYIGVSAGQTVKRGDIIGRVGETGFATGPHLHFTIYATSTFSISSKWFGLLPTGGSLNPMDYL
ncbi:MAG: Membrane-bound metallopeptidase [Parcubacteria group bacterium GW2011_GWA2_39_18]|nr:MAG: Membrane-bound metallopeptidase [Parcubacteria group bacterium GW2011_GWA2_39_18]